MKAVFVGSFDPFTLGHYEIVAKALKIFDKIIVGVAEETGKKTAPVKDRVLMATATLSDLNGVAVKGFSGLATDFCLKHNCNVILRGIRNCADLESEKLLSDVYKRLSDVEIVYMISDLPHISSSKVRIMANFNASLKGYVDEKIASEVSRLYKL